MLWIRWPGFYSLRYARGGTGAKGRFATGLEWEEVGVGFGGEKAGARGKDLHQSNIDSYNPHHSP
jgi:hypothetical protein